MDMVFRGGSSQSVDSEEGGNGIPSSSAGAGTKLLKVPKSSKDFLSIYDEQH